jgi:hypothetical protein
MIILYAAVVFVFALTLAIILIPLFLIRICRQINQIRQQLECFPEVSNRIGRQEHHTTALVERHSALKEGGSKSKR